MLCPFRGPKEVFLSLVQHTDVPYYATSMEIRGDVAIGIAHGVPLNSPDLFRMALHPGPISSADVVYKSANGETLLHAVAQAIGSTIRPIYCSNMVRNERECQEDLQGRRHKPSSLLLLTGTSGWRILARELVTIGADLHAVSTARCWPDVQILLTPLLSLFRGLDWVDWSTSVSSRLQLVAMTWLEDLLASGVDLVEYGRKEKETWNLLSVLKDVPFAFGWGLGPGADVRHIIGFEFGAAPSEWHIWWSEPTDFMAREFWAMVENPEELMPGSWIE